MKYIYALLTLILCVSTANAAIVLNIKNDRVLLDMETEAWQVGDQLIARDESGKAKALLEVKQTKDQKAVAAILKGQMESTYTVTKRPPKLGSTPGKTKSKSSAKTYDQWGALFGMATNSMTVKPSATTSASLSGSSMNLTAFYQRPIDGDFSVRLMGGYQSLQAEGSSSTITACATAGCKVEIGYLGLEALGRYSFSKTSSLDIWGGAGLGFLYAINKSSNVLNTSKITTNQTILLSVGVDWKFSKDDFVPLELDYSLFPDNSTTSASQIILRIGYGTRF